MISYQGEILFSLRSGAIYHPSADIFSHGPISVFLKAAQDALYKDTIKRLSDDKYDHEKQDNRYPQSFYKFCLSRTLSRIRDKRHGGTLLVVPDQLSFSDSRLTDRVIIKYPAIYDHTWNLMVQSLVLHRKYYDLHFPLWGAKRSILKDQYQEVSRLSSQLEVAQESLSDCFRLIASLAGVDGAVVLTDRFRLLGFGAEVIAVSPSLQTVMLAQDAGAKITKNVSIENYGTRHRSALRFCSSYEDSVAFIISQDGGVKAAKRDKSNVLLWPDVNMGSLGI